MSDLIAGCKNVLLYQYKYGWFIVDGKESHYMLKNQAHLIFNDYLGQVMSGKEAKINLELKDK